MADALDDEWWLEEENKTEVSGTTEPVKEKKLKRNSQHDKKEDLDVNSCDDSKKTKRRKKKPKIETVSTYLDGTQIQEELWRTFCHGVSPRLTSLELEDLQISDSCCLVDDTVHTGKLEDFSGYLGRVIPKWEKNVKRLSKKDVKGRPALLLISSSAARSVELNRAAEKFKGDCKTVKLFAKHMKLAEQVTFLKSHTVHFGIGTPNRILKLIDAEVLKTSHLMYVIIDWTWRDAKLRRITDIPEVKEDLWILLEKFVFPLANSGKLHIGLF